MKINIASLVILIFLFFNDVGLPYGMQYTMFLVPFLFFKLIVKYWQLFLVFFVFSLFYFTVHYFNTEMDWFYYERSFLLHFLVFVQIVGFYNLVNSNQIILKKSFNQAVYVNFIFTLIALALLIVGPKELMWEVSHVSKSLGVMPRLRIFTQEPSYYSMLFAPFFFYYFSKQNGSQNVAYVKLVLIILSLFFSFSFGIISGILLSIGIVYFMKIDTILNENKRNIIITLLVLGIIGISALLIFAPNNPLFTRVSDIVSGQDSSGNGRVTEPWILTFRMLEKNNDYLFGIGWGQIRTIGHEIIRDFYQYTETPENKFGLPNVLTEITTVLGIFGLCCTLLTELIFFTVTKVYKSKFRSLVFWFIFIYQFTGSYTSSVLFYAYWVLAFSPRLDIINSNKTELAQS